MTFKKILLDEDDIPKRWYCILPDLPKELPPPINPKTRETVNPKQLEAIFAKELVKQEVTRERWVSIPGRYGKHIDYGDLHPFTEQQTLKRLSKLQLRSITNMRE